MESKDLYIEGNNVTKVVKALSNDIRIKILNLLSDDDMNVQTIATHLNLSKTAVLAHINLLEESGFIKSKYLSGSVGNQRVCHKIYDRLIFNFNPSKSEYDDIVYYEKEILVGNYFDFEAYPPCGLANNHSIIKKWDDASVMCDAERVTASLVWTAFGFIEYKVPVDSLFVGKKITAMEILIEVAAHQMVSTHKAVILPEYISADRITEGVSDVTFWINQVEIGTTTITAGNDPEKATYTPSWWRNKPVHGSLVKVAINNKGCFIGGEKVSNLLFEDIVDNSGFIKFKLGIKPDAKNSSGIMIFGKEFGRYYQDIIVKFCIE